MKITAELLERMQEERHASWKHMMAYWRGRDKDLRDVINLLLLESPENVKITKPEVFEGIILYAICSLLEIRTRLYQESLEDNHPGSDTRL